MHILFLTPAFPPFPGGGERYARSLARELVQRGHHVTAVTSAAQTERDLWQGTSRQQIVNEEINGVQVVRCPIRPFPGGRTGLLAWRKGMVLLSMLPGNQTAVLTRMARFIPPLQHLKETLTHLSTPFDIVHSFNLSWEYTAIVGWQYARQRQIPFIITPYAHLGTGQDRVARNSTMDHQLHLMRDADRVLTLTSIEKAGLATLGVPSARIDVIHGGLDALPAATDMTVLQKQYNLPSPYVIFIGRASYEKGAIHTAQAVLALRQQNVAVSLILVGQTAPEFDRFMQQLNQKERKSIRPLGILSDSDKHGLLANAQALVMPSRTDSFGIVFLEAWAHGKPVIGANSGGIPGVIDNNQTGILVNFGDIIGLSQTIKKLLINIPLNQAMGKHGQEKVSKKYSWDNVVNCVLLAYNKTISKR